jgi:hypothetical protein
VTGTTRDYKSFRAAIDEAIDARIWAGLHFRDSMYDGAHMGQHVAQWVTSRHFRI